jgi:hydrogenase expression/formation protein HypE
MSAEHGTRARELWRRGGGQPDKGAFVTIAHGGGGRLTAEFIRGEILTRFKSSALKTLPDAACLDIPPDRSEKLVFTSDSFVLTPLFLPGCDIGKLAVCGAANDVSVSGGRPLWMSLSLILEEGLSMGDLRLILDSAKAAAERISLEVVTGDTKVVPRGQCDGVYINSSCVGSLLPGFSLGAGNVNPGDAIIVSGTLGDHGMAVMAAREKFGFKNAPSSDCAPVASLTAALVPFADKIKFMRDPTRGGLAAVLNELVTGASFGAEIDSAAIPFSDVSQAAAEILGIDLVNSPCEGRVVLICDASAADSVARAWRAIPEGSGAAVIGKITVERPGKAAVRTSLGSLRLMDWPRGEMLPRIC